jgi:hypothetical protein
MSALGASKKMSARQKESALLEREDFDAGPTNLDCIESGLWLGTCIQMQLMFVIQDTRG